jgi:sulfite reductase (ferredoxin)
VAIPSRNIPQVVQRLSEIYVAERQPEERFQAFIKRIGKAKIRALLDDLTHVPAYMDDRSYYADWGDAREYTLGDMGVGECAGEVVSLTQFGLATSERQVFEAQLLLDEGYYTKAADMAYAAMLQAAKALIQTVNIDVSEDPQQIVDEFRQRFCDNELFYDPFAGPKFAHYFFHAHEEGVPEANATVVHRRIEEAQLFIEAAYSCYNRLSPQPQLI